MNSSKNKQHEQQEQQEQEKLQQKSRRRKDAGSSRRTFLDGNWRAAAVREPSSTARTVSRETRGAGAEMSLYSKVVYESP